MKTTKRVFLFAFSLLLLSSTVTSNAQVTIGDEKAPESFSILELISSTSGVRLPQLNTTQKATLTSQLQSLSDVTANLAKGLTIFNTSTNCLEVWDGAGWVSSCGGPLTSVSINGYIPGRQHYYMFSYQSLELTANGNGGYAANTYSWYKNGVPMPSEKNNTFIFTPTAAEMTAEQVEFRFYCVVGNELGSPIQSNELVITVEKGNLGELKGIPLRKNDGSILYVAAQNLGQENTIDASYFGDFYQYGRAADGHEKWTSETVATQATNSSAPYTPSEVAGKFITETPWTTANINDLWTDANITTNNPCPSGWRIPTLAEMLKILPKSINGSGNTSGSNYVTLNFVENLNKFEITDGSNTLIIPTNAMRLEDGRVGILKHPGDAGEWFSRFWVRQTTSESPRYLVLKYYPTTNRYGAEGTITPVATVRGHFVRCIK